jgi:lipopolysaccharide biosynthesis glycosyltransferase
LTAIPVVLAADKNFCRQLAVVVAGISRHASVSEYTVFVLHDGYDDNLKRRVAESTGTAVELLWIDARSSVLDRANVPHYMARACLYRLMLEELLPPEIERVIYLDTDTVVRGRLDELLEAELGNSVLGAVRDAGIPWATAPGGLVWQTLNVSPTAPYFNSGVLVIPLARWRVEAVSARALTLLSEHRMNYADQCALNVVCAEAWSRLPPRWNLQAAHLRDDGTLAWVVEARDELVFARENPTIVHYNKSGWSRPWESNASHPLRDLWLEDLDRTSWAGWRPKQDGPVGGTWKRVRRAGRALFA